MRAAHLGLFHSVRVLRWRNPRAVNRVRSSYWKRQMRPCMKPSARAGTATRLLILKYGMGMRAARPSPGRHLPHA